MRNFFYNFTIWSALDILIISIALYYLLLLIKGTRSAQVLIGFIVVSSIFFLSSIVPLTAVHWLMSKLYTYLILIMVILFQEEIRRVLSRIGKRSIFHEKEKLSATRDIDELARSVFSLASKKIGALIVIERKILLGRYIDIGIPLEARISKELLLSIFNTTSPMHDGAAIIQKGQIAAAGCFLPLTRDENLSQKWGTRHRAALGVSQETDALVLLVSEELGEVFLVDDGLVIRMHDRQEVIRQLNRLLVEGGDHRLDLLLYPSKGQNKEILAGEDTSEKKSSL